MTPEDILRISEYLEALYIDTHSALVLTLAKHLKSGKKLTVEEWETEKLGELTQVIQQCARVIAQGNAQKEQAIQSTLQDAVGIELTPVDSLLADAVDAGKAVQPISGTWEESARVSEVIRVKAQEMAKKTRLVNTSMLQSAQQAYTRTVQKVASEALVKAIAEAGLESITTGEKSYTTAVSQAIHRLVNRGIYGFTDARGREWSPEAYINMITRTTIHSAAVDAQRERTAEYGVTTFQIGPNKISRPLCAPYVGWICSWDGSSGIIHDLDGNAYQYVPITDTSYGEPAGIFGINCGHSPYTFVDGFSLPRYHEMTPEEIEKNDKAYLLTQKQRAFERDVRSAKLESAALKAAGLDDAEMAQTAETLAKNYEAWCRENNLTPRSQRLQVFVAESKGIWYNQRKPLMSSFGKKHDRYGPYLGTFSVEDTLKALKKIKDDGREELFKGYVSGVNKEEIHPLIGFEYYQKVAEEVEAKLVGITTADGEKIESYASHFINRVIGQYAEIEKGRSNARLGVSVDKVKVILTEPDAISEPQKFEEDNGTTDVRQVYHKKGFGAVTISLRDHRLIQVMPKKRGKRD